MKKILITLLHSFVFSTFCMEQQISNNKQIDDVSIFYSEQLIGTRSPDINTASCNWLEEFNNLAKLYFRVKLHTTKFKQQPPAIFREWLKWYESELKSLVESTPDVYLSTALSNKRHYAARLLLELRNSNNPVDSQLLFCACVPQIADLVIKKGAQLPVIKNKQTPLHYVMKCASYSPDLVTFYLQKELDPNGKETPDSHPPLHFLIAHAVNIKGIDSYKKAKFLFEWAKQNNKKIKTIKKHIRFTEDAPYALAEYDALRHINNLLSIFKDKEHNANLEGIKELIITARNEENSTQQP